MGYNTESMLLQSDNAAEYYYGLFAEVCKNEKVQRRFISPYMHEENAAGEVVWRDLGNGARALMLSCKLPMRFWPLAWRHFNFIKLWVWVSCIHSKELKTVLSPSDNVVDGLIL